MASPTAVGTVLAMLVNREGKALAESAVRGQLYASAEELVVLRPTAREELLHRAMLAMLWGSVALVMANLFLWKEPGVIWVGAGMQAAYWLTLPRRRRALDPVALTAEELASAKAAGRAAVAVPSGAIFKAIPPEAPGTGFRKPARFLLADGALEVYLDPESFARVLRALGR